MTWQEALDYVQEMNRQCRFAYADWRVPNRRELRSLLSFQTSRPALPADHPFHGVFPAWYWTSTTAVINPAYAWYIDMHGGRMFYGGKDQSYLLWPVRGDGGTLLPVTGQQSCYDSRGKPVSCAGSGQDGEFQHGQPWPKPRFHLMPGMVHDRLTNLCWLRQADLCGKTVTWADALDAVKELNLHGDTPCCRLPNINELESLLDCAQANPALSRPLLFEDVQNGYWSSTTSMFEADWAWALYLDKGAVGVGQKAGSYFHVWPVCDFPGNKKQ